MSNFTDKIVLITGGATGLGAAVAVGAAKRGARAVILNCTKSLKEAEATADLVRDAGAEVSITPLTWLKMQIVAASPPPRSAMANCMRSLTMQGSRAM